MNMNKLAQIQSAIAQVAKRSVFRPGALDIPKPSLVRKPMIGTVKDAIHSTNLNLTR